MTVPRVPAAPKKDDKDLMIILTEGFFMVYVTGRNTWKYLKIYIFYQILFFYASFKIYCIL